MYIRPFMITTGTGSNKPLMSINHDFVIACNFFILVMSKYWQKRTFSRAANGIGAKAAGNYGAQFQPTNLANKEVFNKWFG
jgi:branched-chain amino acid aminotransferase